ncbi:hypothetical protein VNO78_21152 [Psophocarpus tetragonolobus]|uniref:Uncharacterized protein n=1 Tax=Psophocarpus tetragonolobus TaxID=3891 RepID=A0AAN9XHE7_PSOTE
METLELSNLGNPTKLSGFCNADILIQNILMMPELYSIQAKEWDGLVLPKYDEGAEKVTLTLRDLYHRCKEVSSKELHEAGDTLFYLPETEIPEWFEWQSRRPKTKLDDDDVNNSESQDQRIKLFTDWEGPGIGWVKCNILAFDSRYQELATTTLDHQSELILILMAIYIKRKNHKTRAAVAETAKITEQGELQTQLAQQQSIIGVINVKEDSSSIISVDKGQHC